MEQIREHKVDDRHLDNQDKYIHLAIRRGRQPYDGLPIVALCGYKKLFTPPPAGAERCPTCAMKRSGR